MTSPIDISNRALSEIGTRSTIAAFDEGSQESIVCALWYDTLRRQLLRAAPWGFARKTAVLSQLGALSDNPPTSPYPWLFKYTYPTDALRVRYLLPPPPDTAPSVVPTQDLFWPSAGPSRSNRFIVANDTDPANHTRRVLLSNLQSASAVYIVDEENTELFDDMFMQALSSAMAAKMVIPLTGNKDMRPQFIQSAMDAVMNARAADGNEAMPTTDHLPDWIAARGAIYPSDNAFSLGNWFVPWDDMNWGM